MYNKTCGGPFVHPSLQLLRCRPGTKGLKQWSNTTPKTCRTWSSLGSKVRNMCINGSPPNMKLALLEERIDGCGGDAQKGWVPSFHRHRRLFSLASRGHRVLAPQSGKQVASVPSLSSACALLFSKEGCKARRDLRCLSTYYVLVSPHEMLRCLKYFPILGMVGHECPHSNFDWQDP